MVTGVETLRQVEAKYPALLFKQQLTAYVEKIYGMIRDNLKKEISPLLGLCIQVFMITIMLACLTDNLMKTISPYQYQQRRPREHQGQA
jgi:hypothetical protein